MRFRHFGALRSLLATLALLGPLATRADAQIIRPGRSLDPQLWAGAGAGFVQMQTVEDYATGSRWDFGTVTQWRATVERSLRNGGAVGVAGTWARPSLAYEGGGCAGACDAEATVFQLMALFRTGGGEGFHQVIELHAGVTGFSDFRTEDDVDLPPRGTVLDPTFSVGYGFAYGFSRRAHLMIVQDVGAVLHRRDDAPAGANTLRQYQTTRIGFRVGR